jgi:ATP-dependent protease ClpP protease subunit
LQRKSRSQTSYHLEEVHKYDIDYDARELYLWGYEEDIDNETAVVFVKNLKFLENAGKDPIKIRILNHGGSWYWGISIYDAIRSSSLYITTVSYGSVSSMASIIPQAADHRIIMPNARFMAHHGYDTFDGNTVGVPAFAQENKIIEDVMIDIYVGRCKEKGKLSKKTRPQIKSFIKTQMEKKDEWWLSAQESVEYGFMDEVT